MNALHDTVRGLSAIEQADAERARRNALETRKTKPNWTPSSGAPRTLYGLGASPGLTVGKLVRHVSQRFEISDQPGDVVAEGEALEQALLAVRAEREELEGRTRQRLSAAEAAIFAAQRELLADPVLVLNLAGTGAGKTRMNAKCACALAGDRRVRFATALNLRTLTLQTGDAYREQLGIGLDELACVIGDRIAIQLHLGPADRSRILK